MRGSIRKGVILAAIGAMLVAGAPARLAANDDSSVGEAGNPSQTARLVEVVMSESADGMHFSPDKIEAQRGEQLRFAIRNAGQLDHEFFLGTPQANKHHAAMMAAMPGMKHRDPSAVTVAPGASVTLVWRFTHKGVFEFACLIPGHYDLGMHGTVTVR